MELKTKPSTVADELDSYLKIYEIFGLQFFSLKASFRENVKQRMSFWRIGQIAVLISLFSVFGGVIYLNTKQRSGKTNVLSALYRESINYLIFVVFWTNLVQSLTSNERVKKFFLNSENISDCCRQHFSLKMSFAVVRKAANQRFFLTMFALMALLGITSYFGRHKTYTDFLLNWLFQFIFLSFTLMIYIKFNFYVCFVNYQLRFLHKLLHLSFKYKKENIYIVSAANEKVESSKVLKSEFVMRKLLIVWDVYNKIIENASIVNSSHGSTLLIMMVDNVLIITYVGYELCRVVLDGSLNMQMSRKFFIFISFVMLVSYRLTFSVICFNSAIVPLHFC